MKVANKNSERLELKELFLSYLPPLHAVSALFCKLCELDVRIFAEKIAPALNITRRFLGTEPNCPVTRFYNEQMKLLLPGLGVEVIEIPRREMDGAAISASRVRALLNEKDFEAIGPLVPQSTLEYLKNTHG